VLAARRHPSACSSVLVVVVASIVLAASAIHVEPSGALIVVGPGRTRSEELIVFAAATGTWKHAYPCNSDGGAVSVISWTAGEGD
jgi:hypothetical protein